MGIKINKNDIKHTTEDPITLFRTGIKSSHTRTTYEKRLKEFVCGVLENYLDGDRQLREDQRIQRLKNGNKKMISSLLDADFEIRANELVKKTKEDPDSTTGILLAYISKLKERCEKPKDDPDYLNPNTVPNMFKPIKKLFKMNGVHFEWERIDASMPESEYNIDTRGYTHDEIREILKFTNPLESTVTLVASSSGIRRGGFDFTWDCIKPIYRRDDKLVMGRYDDSDDTGLVCGMILIYAGSVEQYFALFSPEAWETIKTYKTQWRSDSLQEPQPKDPFLKRTGNRIIPMSCDAMANRLNKILRKAKIRVPLSEGKRNHDIPIMNGFRRFFNKINKETLSRDSPLASLIKKEMMMSHTGLLKLDKNYFQTHWQELVEEYLHAVPALTISPEERIKAENMKLRTERDRYADTDLIKDMQRRLDNIEKGRNIRAGNFTEYLLNEKDQEKKDMISMLYDSFEAIHPEDVKQSCLKKFQKLNEEGKSLSWDFLNNELSEETKIGMGNLAKMLGVKYNQE